MRRFAVLMRRLDTAPDAPNNERATRAPSFGLESS
jgi:hypothetical protein